MNLPRILFLALLASSLPHEVAASDDLGENAGYLTGSITSNSGYPWYPLEGDGPGGIDCILSGTPFEAGQTSVAELSISGPGILSFQWQVESAANDGWLSCDILHGGTSAQCGGMTGNGAGWKMMEVFIPQGASKVRWTYRKNTGNFEPFLEDAGRVADVNFTPLATAAQGFEDWKLAQGITGTGLIAPNGLRLDTCWAMGLDPAAAVPASLNTPVIEGAETRYRMRYSRSATALISPSASSDLSTWSMLGARSQMVAGSLTAATVDFDFFVPTSGKRFFHTSHPSQVTPPSGYAYIPEGNFLMCSPPTELGRWSAENFQHPVTLTRGFFLKLHETTFAEWNDTRDWARANGYAGLGYKAITIEGVPTVVEMGAPGGRLLSQALGGDVTGSGPSAGGEGTQPVSNTSWYETIKWLNAKSEREGFDPCYRIRLKPELGGAVQVFRNQSLEDIDNDLSAIICQWTANGYRLPTEAEWEYACRGGTTTALSNGLDLTYGVDQGDPLDANVDPVAWYYANGAQSHPVGQKAANPFGLHDMHGNMAEWCWDLHNSILITHFQPAAVTDPKGTTSGIYRAMRGGSWRNSGRNVRSAFRDRQIGTLQGGYQVGFRIARNAP